MLWGVGVCILGHVAFQSWPVPIRRTILLMAACAAVFPLLDPYWWERHAVPAYLLLGLLVWSEPLKRRWLPLAWLAMLIVLAVAHLAQAVVK